MFTNKKNPVLKLQKRHSSTMFTNPAKRSKQGYSRANDPPMDGEEGGPPPPPPTAAAPPPAMERATKTPSANKTGSLLVIAIDPQYKEDSDGPGFFCCQCNPGGEQGNELYDSAEKGGIFGPMDVGVLMLSSQASRWTVPPHN